MDSLKNVEVSSQIHRKRQLLKFSAIWLSIYQEIVFEDKAVSVGKDAYGFWVICTSAKGAWRKKRGQFWDSALVDFLLQFK